MALFQPILTFVFIAILAVTLFVLILMMFTEIIDGNRKRRAHISPARMLIAIAIVCILGLTWTTSKPEAKSDKLAYYVPTESGWSKLDGIVYSAPTLSTKDVKLVEKWLKDKRTLQIVGYDKKNKEYHVYISEQSDYQTIPKE